MTHLYDLNYIFKKIKGNICYNNNAFQSNRNINKKPAKNYSNKRNRDCFENNCIPNHHTIDNSPIRYRFQREKSFCNINTYTPKSKSKAKTRGQLETKKANRTIDYNDLTPKKNNKLKQRKNNKSPLRQRTPNSGIRNLTNNTQRTPNTNYIKKRTALKMQMNKKSNSKTKAHKILVIPTNKKQHTNSNTHSHLKFIKKTSKVSSKKKIQKLSNQIYKRNLPSNNHHTYSNSYIKTTIPTTSNKTYYSNQNKGLKKQKEDYEGNNSTIPKENLIENTSVFQSFGKPIIHSNQALNNRSKDTINHFNINTCAKKADKNNNQNSNRKKHHSNSLYQLPEESNKIDFQNLDQFSPPYTWQLSFNDNSNIPSPLKTTYTRTYANDEHKKTNYKTINQSNNRKIINDFVEKIKESNKHYYSTIDYNCNIIHK